jgi:phospholipid transport system substrate-binding protein
MRRVALAISLGLAALGLGPDPAGAAAPLDQIKAATDRVLRILQDPELKKPDQLLVRRQQIRAVANEIFDWGETAKRALGRHWQSRTGPQREEFSALFADLVERSYVGKIEAYSGERVLFAGDTLDGDQATVRTKLVTKSSAEIPIDYRLQREGDRWRAYDVLIEGVSLVANYRSQFNRIITQSSYEELVRKLKQKQEEVEFDDSAQGRKKP